MTALDALGGEGAEGREVGGEAGRGDDLAEGRARAGAPAVTASFVQAVRAAAGVDRPAHARAIARLAAASEQFFAGHADADPAAGLAAIRRATQQHNEGLAMLQAHSGAPILSPVMLQVLALAARHGLAAKPSGAGGGDLLVVFAGSQAELDLFSAGRRRRCLSSGRICQASWYSRSAASAKSAAAATKRPS